MCIYASNALLIELKINANMRRFEESRYQQKINEVLCQSPCRHCSDLSDCSVCSRLYNNQQIMSQFKFPIKRARMFSPSNCVTNIAEFRKLVKESKTKLRVTSHENRDNEGDLDYYKDTLELDTEQDKIMTNFQKGIIFKASKLVERVKESRYGRFFSPRILRNRIKLGRFDQINMNAAIQNIISTLNH